MNTVKKKRTLGIALILASILIVTVSAYVYEQASNTVTQTIQEIATLTLSQGSLGNIEEGQTILYTATNTSALNDILSVSTSKANVYLHLDSDLESQSGNYGTYQIVVKVGHTKPAGGSLSLGDTVATLTIGAPDTVAGIDLDVAGDWTFDFEITTTANSVNSNQDTTVNITALAESTN